MLTHEQILNRVRNHRKKNQPSAIGNTFFMLLVRYASLLGFFVLAGSSIFIYASEGKETDENHRNYIQKCIEQVKEWVHLRSEDAYDQAYLLMVIAVMFLVVYKLTTMVLRRNNYIFMLNEVMDDVE